MGIAISDLDGTLLEVNHALSKILGSSPTGLAGRCLYELFHPHDVALLRTAYQQLVEGKRASSRLPQRFRLIDADGEPAWTYLAVSVLHDSDGKPTHQVTIVEDVTELHLLGQQLRHQSLHDALTGLPNQQFFVSTLEGAFGHAGADSRITVGKIDLNGLAVINDGFGREIGDQVLRSVAGRLQSPVADEQATVARSCMRSRAAASASGGSSTHAATPTIADGAGWPQRCRARGPTVRSAWTTSH